MSKSSGLTGAEIRSITVRRPGLSMLTVTAASSDDAAAVVDVVAGAFLHDPTWSWAFPDPAARRQWWVHCIDNALRFPHAYKTHGFETVSVWIPPLEAEFTHDFEQRIPAVLSELVGARAGEVVELLNRFDGAHPRGEPHFYLSLLATADAHRGRGLGLALLGENLARIDAVGIPAYLESSNPKNNPLYQSMGFLPVTSFQAPNNGPTVTGMWRDRR
jgi:GNAT superfamily N-acetyltransferase